MVETRIKFLFTILFITPQIFIWAMAGQGKSTLQLAQLIPLKCPLNFFFGIHCPTCGLGRSLISLARGSFIESWNHHPLGVFVYLFSLLFLLHLWIPSPFFARIISTIKKRFGRRELVVCVMIYICWGFFREAPLQ